MFILASGATCFAPLPHSSTVSLIDEPPVGARIIVKLYQVDPSRLVATVEIIVTMWTPHFVGNLTTVLMMGSGLSGFDLKTSDQPDPNRTSYYYQGSSGVIQWGTWGVGEVYPFDHYLLNFTLVPFRDDLGNFSFFYSSAAGFEGNSTLALRSTWVNSYDQVPSSTEGKSLLLTLARKAQTGLPLIVAVFASYAFLGFSFLISPKNKLEARLTVYTSIFVLTLGFYFGLGSMLPYRSSFSILEVLFLNLIACSAIAGCGSIASNTLESHADKIQVAALLISLALALVIPYLTGIFGILSSELHSGKYMPTIVFVIPMLFLIPPLLYWAHKDLSPRMLTAS